MMVAPALFHTRDYRGATVEDLDIKPAISVNPITDLSVALEIAYENEFTYLPVIHESNKKLLGVLNVGELRRHPQKVTNSFLKPVVKNYMIWFHQKAREKYDSEEHTNISSSSTTTIQKPTSKGKKFQVLTPWSPLEDLATFFNSGMYFAIITNDHSNFVYGVATPEDLTRYENSRPRL
ncbi:hypothetical protein CANTEDRAFT_103408 [Yamadazyma tenuis ATCC 10573]|uniref:CBS domain-containing protein n=2 Tax=Candida tenuis TaxID=2315449 RepID=G3B151_CANTC|nr:uncharacterized protein CANTEDRAFT_103408 [Yamadazyma tenuis ATCC 10573]EGV64880.1 hypothetical protein CANTEDRAFT_103408 [Yamadazyma tenuis ATCC 10573]